MWSELRCYIVNRLRLSAATIALIGCGATYADDVSPISNSHGADSAAEQHSAARAEKLLWTDFANEPSSLLPQAMAVIGALEGGMADTDTVSITVVNVSALDDDPGTAGAGGCRVMPRPGSRIVEERCFYPTAVEQALNDYQFTEELRFMREAALRRQLEEQASRAARRQAAAMRRRR
jgi:hypothetical protein